MIRAKSVSQPSVYIALEQAEAAFGRVRNSPRIEVRFTNGIGDSRDPMILPIPGSSKPGDDQITELTKLDRHLRGRVP